MKPAPSDPAVIAALTTICDIIADLLATLPPPVDRRLAEAAWQLAVAVQFLQEEE